MNNHAKMIKRLQYLQGPHPEDPIDDMWRKGLVSYRYDFRNLSTDLWYLQIRNNRHKSSCIVDPNDPLKGLWLSCIIVALGDVMTKRPCDLNAWKCDSPPMGIDTCSSTVHICAPAALGFLLSLSDEQEQLGGLRSGTVKDLVRRMT